MVYNGRAKLWMLFSIPMKMDMPIKMLYLDLHHASQIGRFHWEAI